ncbi:MAG: RidA family protein [Nitrospinota bacterium]
MKKEVVVTEKAPLPAAPYAQAVKAGGLVFLSGQVASDFQRAVAPEARGNPEFPTFHSPIRLQTDYILGNVAALLEAGGSSIERVVKIQTFNETMDDFAGHIAVRRGRLTGPPPASTAIEAGTPVPGCRIIIDVIGAGEGVPTEHFNTDRAPRPLAPYSQAVRAGDFWFLAGVLASDFRTGVAPEARVNPAFPLFESSIKKQTEFVLDTIAAILEATGSGLDRIVKAQVILTDIGNFYGFEEVWRHYFPANPPARSTFQGGLVNPGMLVEVDVIALAGDSGLAVRPVETEAVPVPTIHQPQALRVGDFVFTSEVLATDFRTGVSPEARIDPAFPNYRTRGEAQMECCLKYLQALLEAGGSGIESVVKTWTYHTDMSELADALIPRRAYYGENPPASTTAGTGGLVVPDCTLMTEAIALAASP